MNFQEPISGLVERIARALERLAPPSPRKPDFDRAGAFVWQAEPEAFLPVAAVNRVPLILLKGIDRMRDTLLDNTVRFAQGLPANNALLWGARGIRAKLPRQGGACGGKPRGAGAGGSPQAGRDPPRGHRHAAALPRASARRPRTSASSCSATTSPSRPRDTSYKSLKAVLEGGIEGRPEQCDLLRHLEPAASDAARHGGERALDRHQPVGRRSTRTCRSPTASACGSASTIAARTSISTWCGATPRIIACAVEDEALAREALAWAIGARRAIGPRGVAIHPGSGRAARRAA